MASSYLRIWAKQCLRWLGRLIFDEKPHVKGDEKYGCYGEPH